MLPIKRSISIALAIGAVAAGTSLLLGNLGNANSQKIQLAQARIEALARSWESRLDLTRSTFRDQIIRYDLLTILDHPEEWSTDRVEAKLITITANWGKEAGILHLLSIIRSDGTIHSQYGDSNRLSEALFALSQPEKPDLAMLSRTATHGELLIMIFEPAPAQFGHRPARMVALVEPAGLIAATPQAPGRWVLLSGPGEPLIVSQGANPSVPISSATWPLLLAEGSGIAPLSGGGKLCFSKVQIPGMKPLLLVQPYQPTSAAVRIIAIAFLILGVGGLVWRRRSAPTMADAVKVTLPAPASPAEDSSGFRQVFHALEDPICVVDHQGSVIRANNKAHQWFQFHKGVPRGELVLWRENGECRLQDLLKFAGENAEEARGPFSMVMEGQEIVGSVQVTPLGLAKKDRSVLVHFRLYPVPTAKPADRNPVSESSRPDPNCPYPVLAISPDGLIVGFNDAARRTCPRLDESPIVADILPEFGENQLPELLAAEDGHSFESLFGGKPHEFKLVRRNGDCCLYGHPLTVSKNLKIDLEQSQENFCTLCGLAPIPIMLADPRDHNIIEVNPAAADLFGMPLPALKGQTLESLSATEWELTPDDNIFIAQSLSGHRTTCQLRYELIKVEGIPTLLLVLEPLLEPQFSDDESESSAEHPEELSADADGPRALPLGPGLLITLSPTVRETARRMLNKTGHACESFSNLDDVTVWLITHDVRPELIAIDLTDFDDVSSWLEELRMRCGDVPCLAFTDGDDYELPNNGPNILLAKPFDFESLIEALTVLNLDHDLSPSSN